MEDQDYMQSLAEIFYRCDLNEDGLISTHEFMGNGSDQLLTIKCAINCGFIKNIISQVQPYFLHLLAEKL